MAPKDSRRARREARLADANDRIARVDAKLVGESTQSAPGARAKTVNYVPVFVLTAIILIATAVFAFSISQVDPAEAENSPVTGAAGTINVQEEPTVDGGVAVVETEDSASDGSNSGGSDSAAGSNDANSGGREFRWI